MTRDEILNMSMGREMDALIAEKVMGWTKALRSSTGKPSTQHDLWDTGISGRKECSWDEGGDYSFLWKPSVDISAAWEVVEKLVETIPVYMDVGHEGDGYKSNCVHLNHHYPPFLKIEVSADTMPLAICRAALLSLSE